jgi:hypothetical protein
VEKACQGGQEERRVRSGGDVVGSPHANKLTQTLRDNRILTIANRVDVMNSNDDVNDLNVDTEVDSALAVDTVDVVAVKLLDAMVPGAVVEFDPDEAERLGAFNEDALDEADALESRIDSTSHE